MLSNQKLQGSLNEIKEISRMDSALFNTRGKLAAYTDGIEITPELENVVAEFADSLAERQTYQDFHLYKIIVEGETEYILVCLVTGVQFEKSALLSLFFLICLISSIPPSISGATVMYTTWPPLTS